MSDRLRLRHILADPSGYELVPSLATTTFDNHGEVRGNRGARQWVKTAHNGTPFILDSVYSNENRRLVGFFVEGAPPAIAVGHNLLLRNSVRAGFTVLAESYREFLQRHVAADVDIDAAIASLLICEAELTWHLARKNPAAAQKTLSRLLKYLSDVDVYWRIEGDVGARTYYVPHKAGTTRIYLKLPQMEAKKKKPIERSALEALSGIIESHVRVELILNDAYLHAHGLDKPDAWNAATYRTIYEDVLLPSLKLERPPLTSYPSETDIARWPKSRRQLLAGYFKGELNKGAPWSTAISRLRTSAHRDLNLDIDIPWEVHRALPTRLASAFAYHRLFLDFSNIGVPLFNRRAADVYVRSLRGLDASESAPVE